MYLPGTSFIEDYFSEYLTSEIFHRFGSAFYRAKEIEKNLIKMLISFDSSPNAKSYYAMGIGKLINRLKKVGNIPINLERLLDRTCKKRNFLAHGHFPNCSPNSTSIKALEKKAGELKSINMLFNKTSTMLNKIV